MQELAIDALRARVATGLWPFDCALDHHAEHMTGIHLNYIADVSCSGAR